MRRRAVFACSPIEPLWIDCWECLRAFRDIGIGCWPRDRRCSVRVHKALGRWRWFVSLHAGVRCEDGSSRSFAWRLNDHLEKRLHRRRGFGASEDGVRRRRSRADNHKALEHAGGFKLVPTLTYLLGRQWHALPSSSPPLLR